MSLLVLARIGVRVTLPGRRWICGPIVFGQNALMPMVQGLEGRPLWGRAVYTALHGARLSSVPSGDQSLSKSSGGLGAPAKRVSLGSAWADSGSLVFLRDVVGLRTVISNRRLLRQSWCQGPGLVRAGPPGEERGTPHYTVPVSPRCPQEISLLTLPVFQGLQRALLSVSTAQKCSGAERLAAPFEGL